jgi:hypothetical protein
MSKIRIQNKDTDTIREISGCVEISKQQYDYDKSSDFL